MEWISINDQFPTVDEKVLWTNGEFAWSGCLNGHELNLEGFVKDYTIDIDAQWHYKPYPQDFKYWTRLNLPK